MFERGLKMRVASYETEYKRNHVVKQLAKYGYNDTKELTYRELVHKLEVARAMEVYPIKRKEWF